MKISKKVIDQLRLRNEDAFEMVYYEYKDLVFFVAYNILHSRQDAEEIVQDTFLKMLNELSHFDGEYFQAWLLTIAKNLSLNFYRSKKKDGYLLNENLVSTVKAPAFSSEHQTYLELAEYLQPDEYEVVMLRTVYNLKIREVAEYLNKPKGTVSWLYGQALEKLRKKYANGGQNE